MSRIGVCYRLRVLRGPKRLALTCAISASACSADDTDPPAMDAGSDTTAAVTTMSADTSTGDPASSGMMFTATMFPTVGDDTSGDSGPGEAMLVFPGATRWDFLFEEIGDTAVAAIEVLNIGSATATNVGPGADFGSYFSYTGGSYPGQLGNCGEALEPGELCAVHVVFTPMILGTVQDTLVLAYDGGSETAASLPLIAEGRGTTPSLVEDPGFEACAPGSEPDAWTQLEPAFTCIASALGVMPHEGTSMLGVTLVDAGPFEITRRVDLADMAEVIDGRDVTGSLSLWTHAIDGDEIGVELRYLDADDGQLDAFAPLPSSPSDWTEITDERAVPPSTRAVELTVRCLPQSATCDAFVDDTAFTLTL